MNEPDPPSPEPGKPAAFPADPAAAARAVEAVLFLAGEPLAAADLAGRTGAPPAQVDTALAALEDMLESEKRGIRLLRSLEGVQLTTAPEHGPLLEVFLQAGMRAELTPAAAETLAIIAYRGPIHRAGVEEIRGVNSSFILRHLALRGLVTRRPSPTDQRIFLYEVSAEFLRQLGVSSVEELPEYAAFHTHAGMTALEHAAAGEEPHA